MKKKMPIKGTKSIAEYAIRSWIRNQNFDMDFFQITMNGNEGILKDRNGDRIVLVYDGSSHMVYVKD